MGAMPMHVPDFKNVIMPAVVAALDEWKGEATKSESCYLYFVVFGTANNSTVPSPMWQGLSC